MSIEQNPAMHADNHRALAKTVCVQLTGVQLAVVMFYSDNLAATPSQPGQGDQPAPDVMFVTN